MTRIHDPLKGDTNAHTIRAKLKRGWAPRKIAKYMGLSLDEVKAVQQRLR